MTTFYKTLSVMYEEMKQSFKILQDWPLPHLIVLSLIGDKIKKNVTNYQTPISAEERLFITLRWAVVMMMSKYYTYYLKVLHFPLHQGSCGECVEPFP